MTEFLADPRRVEVDNLVFQSQRTLLRAEERRDLLVKAARLEEAIAREVPLTKPRTRRVLAESAISLWWQAGDVARCRILGRVFELEAFASNLLKEEYKP